MYGNVPGPGIALELIQNPQPGMIGKIDVQQNGARLKCRGRGQAVACSLRHDAPKAHFTHQVAQYRGECRIVLYGQNEPPAGRERLPDRPVSSLGRAGGWSRPARFVGPSVELSCRARPAILGMGSASAGAAPAPPVSFGAHAMGRVMRRKEEKTLPAPASLCTVMSPPIRAARSRDMDSPNPVPPNLAVNAAVGLAEMPRKSPPAGWDAMRTPASRTAKLMRPWVSGKHPQSHFASFGELDRVRQQIPEYLGPRRCGSVSPICAGTPGSTAAVKRSRFCPACG